MKRKIIVSITLIVSLFFAILGYNLIDSKLKRKTVVLVIKRSYSTSSYWNTLVAGAMEAAKEFNIDLSIRYSLDETDIIGQQKILDDILAQSPDGLVFSAIDEKNFNKQLSSIKQKGIAVISVDSKAAKELNIPYVGTDNFEAGKEMGIFMKNYASSSTRIGIVGHVKSSSSFQDRKNGILEGLGNSNANLLSIKNTNSTRYSATIATKQMLEEHPQINMILATNEDSALGMYQAISDMGIKDKISMFGFDNSREEARLVERGVFKGIMVQNPFIMGYFSVKNCNDMIEGKKDSLSYSTGRLLITSENIYDIKSQKMIFPIS